MRVRQKFFDRVLEKAILAIVVGFISVFVAYLKGCFDKTEAAGNKTVITNVQKGSGSQYNAARDLIINNSSPKGDTVASKPKSSANIPSGKKAIHSKEIKETIINNGFINNGGKGNRYEQTINNGAPQRHVGENDLEAFKSNIPFDYNVNVLCIAGDNEGEVFAKEFVSKFIESGYNAKFGGWIFVSNEKYGNVSVLRNDSSKTCTVRVFRAKQ